MRSQRTWTQNNSEMFSIMDFLRCDLFFVFDWGRNWLYRVCSTYFFSRRLHYVQCAERSTSSRYRTSEHVPIFHDQRKKERKIDQSESSFVHIRNCIGLFPLWILGLDRNWNMNEWMNDWMLHERIGTNCFFVVFIIFNHGFCSGPLGHIVFSISWLLPLSCPSVVFASAQSASGELSGFILNCILLLVAAVGFDGLE